MLKETPKNGLSPVDIVFIRLMNEYLIKQTFLDALWPGTIEPARAAITEKNSHFEGIQHLTNHYHTKDLFLCYRLQFLENRVKEIMNSRNSSWEVLKNKFD